jgi:primosomal protein N' (replication factor Y)
MTIARVALPVPLRRLFDYRVPDGHPPRPGVRVRVPFGRRSLIGVVFELAETSAIAADKLKTAQLLDAEPAIPDSALSLLRFAAAYYHHPPGEVAHAALPEALRAGRPVEPAGLESFMLTRSGRDAEAQLPDRARSQKRLWERLRAAESVVAEELDADFPGWRPVMARLNARGWVRRTEHQPRFPAAAEVASAPALNPDQRRAAERVVQAFGARGRFLLYGITGSGKTEVYLHAIAECLARGRQALVLVPEIALTPQIVARFRARLSLPVAVFHSGLSARERHRAWSAARSGDAGVLIGTRSAVFVPLARPGLIVVDEEHDPSFKQQEGFRYHARDLAVFRAATEEIPVVLGSATPSSETLANVARGRYTRLELPARAAGASLPRVQLLDLRRLPAADGIARPLLDALAARLERGEQSLIFLNRRGYSPVLLCSDCLWQARCPRCDARLTFHLQAARLRCHHCGAESARPEQCPNCGGGKLADVGAGTERLETALRHRFPSARVLRIDRDTARAPGALEHRLGIAAQGGADILIGTQLLAKGHDLPNVTLVGVVNADQGLYSVDYRAVEHLVQQIIQVSGRAGRADKPGEVMIQTLAPDNPYLADLVAHDYDAFARRLLAERRAAGYPPFAHFALLRAESARERAGLDFLRQARSLGRALAQSRGIGVSLFDPVPAPMERRAGRYRAQLLASAERRNELHELLTAWLGRLDDEPLGRTVRWSVDVDPLEMY